MSVDSVPKGLAKRIKHQAAEFRDLRRCISYEQELTELLCHFSKSLKEAMRLRLVPEQIAIALEIDAESYKKGFNLFWELGLANSVLGYTPWGFDVFTEPNEYDDESGICWDGERHLLIQPGYIALAWPGVFDVITSPILSDEDLGAAGKSLWENRRHAIFGYYATACDLLADWIENHADDDQVDQGGDRDAVGSTALGAVVAGGLAGVLQAAVGARAVDRVTAIIRKRVAADGGLRSRTADHWAAELQVTKKTVTDSVGWREIMEWRAANKADRVSKKTGK